VHGAPQPRHWGACAPHPPGSAAYVPGTKQVILDTLFS